VGQTKKSCYNCKNFIKPYCQYTVPAAVKDWKEIPESEEEDGKIGKNCLCYQLDKTPKNLKKSSRMIFEEGCQELADLFFVEENETEWIISDDYSDLNMPTIYWWSPTSSFYMIDDEDNKKHSKSPRTLVQNWLLGQLGEFEDLIHAITRYADEVNIKL